MQYAIKLPGTPPAYVTPGDEPQLTSSLEKAQRYNSQQDAQTALRNLLANFAMPTDTTPVIIGVKAVVLFEEC